MRSYLSLADRVLACSSTRTDRTGATPKSSYHRCRDLVSLATGELSTTEESSVVGVGIA